MIQIRDFIGIMLMSVIILSVGCDRRKDSTRSIAYTSVKLSIYMYDDFPADKARMLETELKKYFQDVELIGDRRALPHSAYVNGRNRYRGSGLLDDLNTLRSEEATLGLTSKIICIKNELSPDYGIMGLSYLGKGVAVVSSTIPKNGKTHTDDNLIKLALHELGHAYGLPHCPDQKCIMVDAEHRMKLPQTTGFCNNCRGLLKKKGLNLSPSR